MAGHNGSVNSEPVDKPCRACTDFKVWTKLRRKEQESTTAEESEASVSRVENPPDAGYVNSNCPLSRDELGRKTWGFLHTMAAYYPEKPTDQQKSDVTQFLKLFSQFYPCHECAEDLQHQIERFPPKTESQHELSQWLCRVHNRVNLRLGKPLFDCATINERWRDGWKDGSCD